MLNVQPLGGGRPGVWAEIQRFGSQVWGLTCGVAGAHPGKAIAIGELSTSALTSPVGLGCLVFVAPRCRPPTCAGSHDTQHAALRGLLAPSWLAEDLEDADGVERGRSADAERDTEIHQQQHELCTVSAGERGGRIAAGQHAGQQVCDEPELALPHDIQLRQLDRSVLRPHGCCRVFPISRSPS